MWKVIFTAFFFFSSFIANKRLKEMRVSEVHDMPRHVRSLDIDWSFQDFTNPKSIPFSPRDESDTREPLSQWVRRSSQLGN